MFSLHSHVKIEKCHVKKTSRRSKGNRNFWRFLITSDFWRLNNALVLNVDASWIVQACCIEWVSIFTSNKFGQIYLAFVPTWTIIFEGLRQSSIVQKSTGTFSHISGVYKFFIQIEGVDIHTLRMRSFIYSTWHDARRVKRIYVPTTNSTINVSRLVQLNILLYTDGRTLVLIGKCEQIEDTVFWVHAWVRNIVCNASSNHENSKDKRQKRHKSNCAEECKRSKPKFFMGHVNFIDQFAFHFIK